MSAPSVAHTDHELVVTTPGGETLRLSRATSGGSLWARVSPGRDGCRSIMLAPDVLKVVAAWMLERCRDS